MAAKKSKQEKFYPESATNHSGIKNTNPTSKPQQNSPEGEEILLTRVPDNVLLPHGQIIESESRINALDTRIAELRDLLRPISQIERRRGARSKVRGGMRKYYQVLLKRLEEERFIESDNWAKLMKEFGDTIRNDIKRTKTDFLLIKAKSTRYISKNISLVTNRLKNFMQELHQLHPDKLVQLKETVNSKVGKELTELIKSILNENDSTRFLSVMYSNLLTTQENDLLYLIHQTISQLLSAWEPSIGQNFSFKDIEAKVTKRGQR